MKCRCLMTRLVFFRIQELTMDFVVRYGHEHKPRSVRKPVNTLGRRDKINPGMSKV